jgi:hypothetical protein
MREPSTGKPSGGGYPAGEKQNQPFQLSFNASLRVDFQGSCVPSDGGLILVRELDDRLAFGELIEQLPIERGAALAECARLQLGEALAAAGAAPEDRRLVVDQLAAAVGEDRRTASETCAVLLAAAGRRASHAAAFWQHAEKDCGAAAAERVANQERQRVGHSEVIQSGQVSAARQVGGEKQTKQVSETAKRAAMQPEGGYVDLNLTH